MAKPKDILYHYTTQDGLLSILENKTIWATNILFLNDSKEFNHTIQLALEFLKNDDTFIGQDLHESVKQLFSDSQAPNVYVASFTEKKDQLSQWRAYCPNLGGFNIGFETKKLVKVTKPKDIFLIQCNYNLEKQKEIIKKSINKTCNFFNHKADINYNSEGKFDIDSLLKLVGTTRLNYGLQLLLIASYFKHPAFDEEKEWRLVSFMHESRDKKICFRKGISMVIPYVEFKLSAAEDNPLPIKEIVIGPTPHQELSKKSVEKLIIKHGIPSCNVVLSGIPYRAW